MNSLSKRDKVKGLKLVQRLFADGKSKVVYPFKVVYLVQDSDVASCEILISVPKRNIKLAVKRNLIKRRFREAYRLEQRLSVEGKKITLAFIYLSKDVLEYDFIQRKVKKSLSVLNELLKG